ncbi:3558_t:CDS:2, partial [Cetraspora pellucida]
YCYNDENNEFLFISEYQLEKYHQIYNKIKIINNLKEDNLNNNEFEKLKTTMNNNEETFIKQIKDIKARIHKSTGKSSHTAISFFTIIKIINFILSYANKWELPSPEQKIIEWNKHIEAANNERKYYKKLLKESSKLIEENYQRTTPNLAKELPGKAPNPMKKLENKLNLSKFHGRKLLENSSKENYERKAPNLTQKIIK